MDFFKVAKDGFQFVTDIFSNKEKQEAKQNFHATIDDIVCEIFHDIVEIKVTDGEGDFKRVKHIVVARRKLDVLESKFTYFVKNLNPLNPSKEQYDYIKDGSYYNLAVNLNKCSDLPKRYVKNQDYKNKRLPIQGEPYCLEHLETPWGDIFYTQLTISIDFETNETEDTFCVYVDDGTGFREVDTQITGEQAKLWNDLTFSLLSLFGSKYEKYFEKYNL